MRPGPQGGRSPAEGTPSRVPSKRDCGHRTRPLGAVPCLGGAPGVLFEHPSSRETWPWPPGGALL
jgi:hypothetical protein